MYYVRQFIFLVENSDAIYSHSAKYCCGISYVFIFKNDKKSIGETASLIADFQKIS